MFVFSKIPVVWLSLHGDMKERVLAVKNAQCLDAFPLQARSHDLERGGVIVGVSRPNDQCV